MNYGCNHTKILVTSIFNYNIEKLWAINLGNWQPFLYKFEHNLKINADIKVIYIVNNCLLYNILYITYSIFQLFFKQLILLFKISNFLLKSTFSWIKQKVINRIL